MRQTKKKEEKRQLDKKLFYNSSYIVKSSAIFIL